MLVVGDVNSTLAGAITANKMGLPLGHLESGLRSQDRGMPEEINRILTDQITDHYFITEQSGMDHLLKEGRPAGSHALRGQHHDRYTREVRGPHPGRHASWRTSGLGEGGHVLMTIHRPATVDDAGELAKLVDLIALVAKDHPVVFPVHPRTTNNLKKFGLHERLTAIKGLHLSGPMDYFAFQKLIATCAFVITDSGGIQEETTFRRVPCLTLRPNTERPSTVTLGTNELITFDLAALSAAIGRIRPARSRRVRCHRCGMARPPSA